MDTILKPESFVINIKDEVYGVRNRLRRFYENYRSRIHDAKDIKIEKLPVGMYKVTPPSDFKDPPDDIYRYGDISTKYMSHILDITKQRDIIVRKRSEIFAYVMLSELLYAELILHKLKNGEAIKKERQILNQYLDKAIIVDDGSDDRLGVGEGINKLKTPIAFAAKNTFVWKRDELLSIPKAEAEALRSLGLKEVEFPKDYDANKLIRTLDDIKEFMDFIKVDNREFILRFKKLGTYKNKAMYFKGIDTIILDSRHVQYFKHEMGHYLYEREIPFDYNGVRVDRKKMDLIVANEKKRGNVEKYEKSIQNIESYKVESEIFACWFENNVSKYVVNDIVKID